METKEETQVMRKRNMKLFPLYKRLAWDYLFFYTIDFLFLTQIKGISASDVVLKSTFYSLFGVILQIPANIIVEFLGRKNSAVLGNVLNCLYIVILMISRNLGDLIFAEFISATAFAIKNIAEPSLLNESIPPSRYKSQIFARISAKGASGYYFTGAVSKVVAGFLFQINGYLPMMCSLIILIITVIMSMCFIEPVKKKKRKSDELVAITQLKEIEEGFRYVLKSERLKALILCAALINVLITIFSNYSVSLLEDLKLSALIIGIISAVMSLISAFASRKQGRFHNKLKNKSLMVIAMIVSISFLIAGLCGLDAQYSAVLISLLIASYLIFSFGEGMYYTIIDKYLRNFSNGKIDTKIFAAKNLFVNVVKVIGGLCASFLLGKMSTAYCMIIIGIIFLILIMLVSKYMKVRVGLKPEEYSKEEIKYDELKADKA